MPEVRATKQTLGRATVLLDILDEHYRHQDEPEGANGTRGPLMDLLADIRHLCEVREIPFHAVNAGGFTIYKQECA